MQRYFKRERNMKISAGLLLSALFTAAISVWLLCCSTAGARILVWSTEQASAPITSPTEKTADAIVVLTGGDLQNMEAARLHLETGLPILASGGDGEAPRIKKYLESQLNVRVMWTEDRSMTTEENARFSSEILERAGVHRIILVTYAMHMRRARFMFSDQGLEVIAAPTRFSSFPPLQWEDLVPSAEGQMLAKTALHEIGGLVFYGFRRWFA
jgi:uncharacterized SAM-binding protein YcdF (DUF218 family)